VALYDAFMVRDGLRPPHHEVTAYPEEPITGRLERVNSAETKPKCDVRMVREAFGPITMSTGASLTLVT
jgi:hypothetical protein